MTTPKFDDVILARESEKPTDTAYVCQSCLSQPEHEDLKDIEHAIDGSICSVIGCSNTDDVFVANLNTINGHDSITLFHGTTKARAASILENGIDANTYLTTNEELAEYFGECACDEQNLDYSQIQILKVRVIKSNLRVDFEAYAEPITIFRNDFATSDTDWHEMCESGEIPYPSNEKDIEPALKVTTCVKTAEAVTSQYIS